MVAGPSWVLGGTCRQADVIALCAKSQGRRGRGSGEPFPVLCCLMRPCCVLSCVHRRILVHDQPPPRSCSDRELDAQARLQRSAPSSGFASEARAPRTCSTDRDLNGCCCKRHGPARGGARRCSRRRGPRCHSPAGAPFPPVHALPELLERCQAGAAGRLGALRGWRRADLLAAAHTAPPPQPRTCARTPSAPTSLADGRAPLPASRRRRV